MKTLCTSCKIERPIMGTIPINIEGKKKYFMVCLDCHVQAVKRLTHCAVDEIQKIEQLFEALKAWNERKSLIINPINKNDINKLLAILD